MAFTVDDFRQQLAFEPDEFQCEAIAYIERGDSVVVCAPTGSGKTLIAEYAAYRALDEGKKLFYTTPLKALSNQKFFDLKERFGEANVGLLTGDLSVNREARMVVMTTEVFRNMLYGMSADSRLLDSVGNVVLDECHFMNDRERGTVWEECIIYCPSNIQIIALSATVANAEELTRWIDHVHGPTHLVYSDFRPVPLRFTYYHQERLLPLFESESSKLNEQIKPESRPPRDQRKGRPRPAGLKPAVLLTALAEKDMLPAIMFTFSRRGCDDALKHTRGLQLLKADELERVEAAVTDFLQVNPFLADHPHLAYIRQGVASHHAGLLPGLKQLVESLFQQGLLKAVFATETLAAGINMPARTTVITSISKRTQDGHRLLTASEFLQMSGRAGRRGMDKVGYVVIVSSPFKHPKEVATLASSPPEPLNSQFTPTYGMVLNLLQRHTLEQAEFLLSKSFGQYTAERRLKPLEKEIRQKSMELAHYLQFECPYQVEDEAFQDYLKQRAMLNRSQELVQVYKKQLKRHGVSDEMKTALAEQETERECLVRLVESSSCDTCSKLSLHQRNERKILQMQTFLKSLNTVHHQESELYWRQFLNIATLLQRLGYLNAEYRPTPDGHMMGQVRAENELFIAELLRDQVLAGLTPPELAAVISVLVTDNIRTDQEWFSLSPNVAAALEHVARIHKKLEKQQQRHSIHLGMPMTPLTAGLTEAWASGMAWDQLVATSRLDEGDIVRMLRRTCDMLRQLSRIPELSVELANHARQANQMAYRDPIQEVELIADAVVEV